MKFLILGFLIGCLINSGQSFPSAFHLKLKTLCPNVIFTFEQNGHKYIVNSYYEVGYKYEFEKQENMKMPMIDFQKFYINSAVLINRLRDVFNEELNDLYAHYIEDENFLKRNLTIKLNYLDDIKTTLVSFRKEFNRSEEGLKALNQCIDILGETNNLVRLLQKTQQQYTSNDFFNSSQFDKSFFTETNDKTELAVFDSNELMENIQELGIFKFDKIHANGDKMAISLNFYVPFQSTYTETFDCVKYDNLPPFYRTRGRDYFRQKHMKKKDDHGKSSAVWSMSFNHYVILQILMFVLFFKNRFA